MTRMSSPIRALELDGAPAAAKKIVVQQSFPDPRPTTNPYIVMLKRAIESEPDAELRTFTWRRAIFRRYDVMHTHWPEILLFGHSPLKTLMRQILCAILLTKLTLTRTPVVRTVHNLELPSPMTRRQVLLLRWFDRLTVSYIVINPTTELSADVERTVILHGHYRDWFASFTEPESIPGRLGYFGLIRRYKQVESLLAAFRNAPPDWTLRVAGRPSDEDLSSRVKSLADTDSRIDLRLTYIDDADLVELVGESELVVLPYTDMHNSGALLTTLSLHRPVLVPANRVNALIAAEVGPGWVHQFRGTLTEKSLLDAMTSLRIDPPTQPPDLSGREWRDVGRAHRQVYARALSIRRAPFAAGRAYSR